jgi:16S rRNA (adenine1518-N6/adenine1519-N6)-dimethyltransferase
MIDPNFASAVARDAGVDEKTLIIEVGPGTGCLTRALLDAHPGSRVLAIEIDRGLVALLRETFASDLEAHRLTLIEGDVLESKHSISPAVLETVEAICSSDRRSRRVLCANLPYNIATPLLANAAADTQGLALDVALATIQLELAQRLLASAGGDDYGALSAFMKLRADGEILRRIGNEVFWPRPNVDSAVIRLRFKPWSGPDALLRKEEAAAFQQFLQNLFSQRRKTLRAALKPQTLPELGLPADARAEALSGEVLLKLFRALKS